LPVFKTGAFNRSAIPPAYGRRYYQLFPDGQERLGIKALAESFGLRHNESPSVREYEMPLDHPPGSLRPIASVSAALVSDGHILMVRRRHRPNAGLLALPGGKIEAGEGLQAAAARELREETGLIAEPAGVVTAIDVFDRGGRDELLSHHVVVVVRMTRPTGRAAAADDATEVRWMDADMIASAHGEVCPTAAEVSLQVLAASRREDSSLRATASGACAGNFDGAS
jgi:8-oxo-dGTP diphosphatase